MSDEIPISTIKLPVGRLKCSLTYPCPQLTWNSRRSQNKTFIRGASPDIPYDLWDKHTISWQRWIATQERKFLEVEIVTFVVKVSVQLTVPSDRKEYPNEKILHLNIENFTLLQKTIIFFRKLYYMKRIVSTKLEPIKISFSIQKLIFFFILILIDLLKVIQKWFCWRLKFSVKDTFHAVKLSVVK